jgi:hypothetical protein
MLRTAVSTALLLALSAAASAAPPAFTTSGQAENSVTLPWPVPLAAQTITQSTATTIGTQSISCNGGAPGFFHAENSYYRAFTLSTFPALTLPQFRIDSVTIGVQQAVSAGAAGQGLSVNLWRSSANPPTLATLTAVSTDSITVPDSAAGTLLSIPIASQPVFTVATDILVVEILTPDGQAKGNSFFIGSNAAGQSGSSFIRSASCSVNDITNLASIGFATMHIVMSVTGNNQVPVSLQRFEVD